MKNTKQGVNALVLEGDAFNALKSDFNMVLRKTLANMQHKGADTAELKVSLKISLTQENALDQGADDDREVSVPKFDHKVSSVMQLKAEKSGSLGGVGWELMWDKELGQYVLVKIKDAQRSLFDDEEDGEDYRLRYLPAPEIDIVDVEYTDEVEGDDDEADDEGSAEEDDDVLDDEYEDEDDGEPDEQ